MKRRALVARFYLAGADIVTVVFWLVSWPGTSVNRQ